MTEEPIDRLLAAFQAGDHDAFARIFQSYVDAVYRFILFKVSQREDAEDLTQTVFLKAWDRRKQFSGKGSMKAWLFQIARNTVIDFYRTRKRVEELPQEVTDDRQQHWDIGERIDAGQMFTTIQLLEPKEYGEVLMHRFVNELTVEETAQAMGKTAGAVRVLQHRALEALRKRMPNA